MLSCITPLILTLSHPGGSQRCSTDSANGQHAATSADPALKTASKANACSCVPNRAAAGVTWCCERCQPGASTAVHRRAAAGPLSMEVPSSCKGSSAGCCWLLPRCMLRAALAVLQRDRGCVSHRHLYFHISASMQNNVPCLGMCWGMYYTLCDEADQIFICVSLYIYVLV